MSHLTDAEIYERLENGADLNEWLFTACKSEKHIPHPMPHSGGKMTFFVTSGLPQIGGISL